MKPPAAWMGLLLLALTACAASVASNDAPSTPAPKVELKHYGPAPELTNTTWLNAEAPLRLADLRGQVVLLDMWTFG